MPHFGTQIVHFYREDAAATDAPGNDQTAGNLACKLICAIFAASLCHLCHLSSCVYFVFLLHELRQPQKSKPSGVGKSSGSNTMSGSKNCKYFASWQTIGRDGLQYITVNNKKQDIVSTELGSSEDLEAIKTFSEEVLASEKAKRTEYDGEHFMLGKQLVIKWIRAQDVEELNTEMATAYIFGQHDS